MACDYVIVRFQCSRKALQHESIIVHWVTHVGVVFQAALSCRLLGSDEPEGRHFDVSSFVGPN